MLGFSSWFQWTQEFVSDYIHFWVRLNKVPRSMIVIEKLKILNDGLNKNNKEPFILPFVASQLP